MLMLLTTIGLGFLLWWFLQPTALFVRGFAGLLDSSDFSPTRLFSHRTAVSGRFHGRAVGLDLQQPQDNRFGRVDVLMQTSAPDGAPWKDSALVSRNPDISRATFALEGRYALALSLERGWLRASYSPLMVRFPGRFDREKWSDVLQQMETLAQWLERA